MIVPTLAIVSGPPCSGKSTLAQGLARELGWPLVAKDAFKEPLFDVLDAGDPGVSRHLSELAFAAQFAAARALLETGSPVLLEGNFRRDAHGPAIMALAGTGDARLLQLACTAPAGVLAARRRDRALSGMRHPGHGDGATAVLVPEAGLYAPLADIPTRMVDTSRDLPREQWAELLAWLGADPRVLPATPVR